MSFKALLTEIASIKRHDPNRGRDGYVSKVLTLNVPVELLNRIDQKLATPVKIREYRRSKRCTPGLP